MTCVELVRAYVAALEGSDGPGLIGLLAEQPRFVSPFSVWSTPELVASACTARTRAFTGFTTRSTLIDGDEASIRWQAEVGERTAEGVDLVGVVDGRISTIDVFLRPADALSAVYDAMSAAWPSPRDLS